MPLLADLCLAMRIDPLALIRGVSEIVAVLYGAAMTFAFPDAKIEAYRRSVLHLNLVSVVDGITLIWCGQKVLREAMTEDSLFAKVAEPNMTAVSLNNKFRDRMSKEDGGHHEVFPKLWILQTYDRTNSEITRIPRLLGPYHRTRK